MVVTMIIYALVCLPYTISLKFVTRWKYLVSMKMVGEISILQNVNIIKFIYNKGHRLDKTGRSGAGRIHY